MPEPMDDDYWLFSAALLFCYCYEHLLRIRILILLLLLLPLWQTQCQKSERATFTLSPLLQRQTTTTTKINRFFCVLLLVVAAKNVTEYCFVQNENNISRRLVSSLLSV